MLPTGIPSLRLCGLRTSHASSTTTTTATLSPPLTTSTSSSSDSTSTTEQSFIHPSIPMPPPGPSHYEARRALWLAPSSSPPPPPSPSTSRAKLEMLLNREDSLEDEEVWNNSGLKSVWKGLLGGGRLRRRLPLCMVIKILKAGWLRDGTWPVDAATGSPSPIPNQDAKLEKENAAMEHG